MDAGFITGQQFKNNLETGVAQQAMSQTNQVTPYGNLSYSMTGGYSGPNGVWIPQYTATQTLNPNQQKLLDSRTNQQQGLFNLAEGFMPQLQQGLSTNLPTFGALPDTKAFTDDAYKALMSRSNQDIGAQRDAQRVLNANQGVAAGSDAYNRSFQPIDRSAVDASQQATINAQQLADQYFNRELAGRTYQMQDAVTRQQNPFQQYSSLFNLAGGNTDPNLVNTPQAQIQTPDMTSPYMGQAQMAQQGALAGQAASSSRTGAMAGLAGAALTAAAMF